MVTWTDVLRWDPAPTRDAVGPLNAEFQKLVGASDELRTTASVEGWSGPAATAATGRVNQLIDAAEELAAELGAARRTFGDVGDAITGIVHAREEALAMAQAHHFAIGPDGSVIDKGPPPDTPPDQTEAVAAERRHIAAEIRDRVAQILRQAADIDGDACAVIDKLLAGTLVDTGGRDNADTTLASFGDAGFTLGGLSILSPPGDGATVAQNAAWWDTLSANQQRRLIHDLPELVGNRDGLPGWARSEANLALVGRQRTHLQSARADIQAQLGKLTNGPGHGNTRNILQAELDRIDGKLAGLRSIETMVLDPRTGEPKPNRQLLSLDMGGDRPKAAVASGNIDTAEHVGVFTPGMNSTVDGNMAGYVNDTEEIRGFAAHMLGDLTKESVAMVTWLGYEPPSGNPETWPGLVTGDPAEEGGEKLARFQEGIGASRPPGNEPHLTALGHSYGSATTGIALTQNHGVDDAIFFGSPGISGDWEFRYTADNLNVPEGHAYNLSAEGDPVADYVPVTGRYGPNVDHVPGVNQLSTDEAIGPRGPMAASHGHSEYIVSDGRISTSEHNIAAIVSGNSERAIYEK